MTKWTFHDPETGQDIVLPINPSAAELPGYERRLTYQGVTANATWDGRVTRSVVFEGAEKRTFMCSGQTIDAASYSFFIDWFRRRHAVVLTDDLGRQFVVYVKTFRPKRAYSTPDYIRNSYDLEFAVLSSPTGDL